MFEGTDLVDVVRTQSSAGAFKVGLRGEEPLEPAELEPPPIDAELVSIEEYREARRHLQHG